MGQFAPDFVFTDPTLASQMVRLSELNAAHKNEQQRLSTNLALQYAALRSREQQQQGNQAYQYAALANQQRAQDLADKRAAAELASRENMFGQQMGLSREGLQLQRELGLANPYGRAAGDILLGGMQTNNQVDQANADSETEARNLTAALNSRYQRFLQDYHAVDRDIPHWYKINQENVARGKEAVRNSYLGDKAALIGSAKHSSYDEASGTFVPVKRNMVQMPGMGRLNTQQPAGTSGNTQEQSAPIQEAPATPQVGNFYQQLWGGAPQNQLQFGGPSLNPYPMTPPPGAGVFNGGGGLDGLKQRYLNGDISAEDYLQQFDGLNQ